MSTIRTNLCLLALVALMVPSPSAAVTEMLLSGSATEDTDLLVVQPFFQFNFYVLATASPSVQVTGWEAEVSLPPEVTVLNRTLSPASAIQLGADDNFIVGTGAVVPIGSSPTTLLTYLAMVFDAMEGTASLGPSTPSSVGGTGPAYVASAGGVIAFDEADDTLTISTDSGTLAVSAQSDAMVSSLSVNTGELFNMYVLADTPGAVGMLAWETGLGVPSGIELAGDWVIGQFAIDAALGVGNFVVGLGECLASPGPLHVATVQAWAREAGVHTVTLQPATPASSTSPGWIECDLSSNIHEFTNQLALTVTVTDPPSGLALSTQQNSVVSSLTVDTLEQFSLYAVADHTATAFRSMRGWEGAFSLPSEVTLLNTTLLTAGGVNVGSGTNFIVGMATCVDAGIVPLVQIDLLPTAGGVFNLTFGASTPSSVGGAGSAWLTCDQQSLPVFQSNPTFTLTVIDTITSTPETTDVFHVAGAFPNPMGASTSVKFSLPAAGPVELSIYDARGRLVRRGLDGLVLGAGPHRWSWDRRDQSGSSVGAGVYFARVQHGEETGTAKILAID